MKELAGQQASQPTSGTMSGEISRRTGASELVKDDAVTVTTEAKVSGEQVIATEQEKTDAQDVSVVLVDFESGDPEDPQNWSPRYKWTVTSMLTVMSFTVYAKTFFFSGA